MKLNQLVDDAAENFEVAQAINFADLSKQAQLQAQYSQLRTEYNNYFNNLFINGKEFSLRRLDWRDLINSNYLEESLIGIVGYPWYVLNKIAIIWTVFNLLQFLFGLFRNVLNTYNLKSLLGPNITLAKIITTGFLEYSHNQYSRFYKLLLHTINHLHLKIDVNTPSIVALHTIKRN